MKDFLDAADRARERRALRFRQRLRMEDQASCARYMRSGKATTTTSAILPSDEQPLAHAYQVFW